MGEITGIEWTDHTFNPWWGCEKVSPACANCYAETFSNRFPKTAGLWGANAPRKIASEKVWREPLLWNKKAAEAGVKRTVFCASMADVFEDRRDLDEPRRWLWAMIEATPRLIWLLLTKRPENVEKLAPAYFADGFPDNVCVGTTVESEEYLLLRVPHLLKLKARARFLSMEPLLGFTRFNKRVSCSRCLPTFLSGVGHPLLGPDPLHNGIQWVIVGGESGDKARPMHPDWARVIREECCKAGVPFFFKQWGEWTPRPDLEGVFEGDPEASATYHALKNRARVVNYAGGHGFHGEGAMIMENVGKKKAGSLLDGVECKAFPAWFTA